MERLLIALKIRAALTHSVFELKEWKNEKKRQLSAVIVVDCCLVRKSDLHTKECYLWVTAVFLRKILSNLAWLRV